jgi:hypothetical protein
VVIASSETRKQGGARLKEYVLDRFPVTGLDSLVQLAEEADVDYDTLHAWFRGRAPSAKAGGRVAERLGVTYSELLAAYEGRDPMLPVRDDELRRLIEAAVEIGVRRALSGHNGQGRT